jgi:hypothetical protein
MQGHYILESLFQNEEQGGESDEAVKGHRNSTSQEAQGRNSFKKGEIK